MNKTDKTSLLAAPTHTFYADHGVAEDIKKRLESTALVLITATRRSTDETFELGEHLENAAVLLPDGTVEKWAVERCGYTARHIRTLRATARNLGAYREALVELAVGPTVVGKLSSATPEQIEQAIDLARENGRLRVQDVTAIIAGSQESARADEDVDPFDAGGLEGLKAIIAIKVREGMKSFIGHLDEIRAHVEEALKKKTIVKKTLVETTALTARLAHRELESLAEFVAPNPHSAFVINSTRVPAKSQWGSVSAMLYQMGSDTTWPDKAALRTWLETEVVPVLTWATSKTPRPTWPHATAVAVSKTETAAAGVPEVSKSEAASLPSLEGSVKSMFAGFGIDARVDLAVPEKKDTIPTLTEALAQSKTRGLRSTVLDNAKLAPSPAA